MAYKIFTFQGSIAAFLLLSSSYGFGTINEPGLIGQHCEHERITRAAFACHPGNMVSDGRCFEPLSLDQLAGTSGPDGYVGQGSNGAVGAPDMLDPVPEGPEAHCDNADFLDTASLGLGDVYPRTREEATASLQACVNHLRLRFEEGIDAADKIVDEEARIFAPHVDLSMAYCRFSFPDLQMHMFSRSKCSAIEGFGRALHGVQDFYAHSNWADDAKPPFGLANPPGLNRKDYPDFLDLRGENEISEQVPYNLSTGCFGGILTDGPEGKAGHPLEPGSKDCSGRITHHTLNKDNGIIDPVTGSTESPGPGTPRSDFPGNFERAVSAAIRDTRRQWRHFREEIRRTYGTERGNVIICALVRDNPTTDCYGRRVAVIEDVEMAKGNSYRIAEMQMPVHKWLQEELEGKPHDEGPGEGITSQNATKSRGSSSEMNRAAAADAEGGVEHVNVLPVVNEGLDFATVLTDLLKNTTGLPTNKTAIIALTSTRNLHLGDQVTHIRRAAEEQIRVHLGLLPPSQPHVGPMEDVEIALGKAKEEELIAAVLETGGTYSVLHSQHAVASFLDHVVSRGLTQYDNARDTATLLLPGLSIGDYVTPLSEPRRFQFDAHAMDNVVITVSPISSKLSLNVRVRHVRRNAVITELDIGLSRNATFRAEVSIDDIPRGDAWFELEVTHIEGDGLRGSGLFEVNVESEDVGLSDADKFDKKNGYKHDDHDEL
ncbi:uncharacterized protein PV09_04392 [Verruconis gallopava]|uniref:Uncharacterized protein n=1 Tax=Verruconis gallopava TaxID=253628 RepID=A0A0D1YVD4_9PEZI|nr:uncharacterized protein PV09_04392 [Verruconis gallopava]KIW04647.1 hypothetical protein PV09_04392 [Verruconis gallopava]